MLTIGTLTLDDDPYVSISYQYNQSSNGRVIGGTKKITLTGTIIGNSASDLIDKSNEIKNWFSQSSNRYHDSVTINGQIYSFIVIDNISIDSDDWVHSFNYSIDLISQIESSAVLPSNILSLTYSDYLTSLDITETLSIQADKQNTYYLTANGLKTIENSVVWDMKISVTCRRSHTKTAIQNANDLLQNILITIPDRQEFNEYKTWNMYLQNRSLDSNPSNGSLSFSCKIILVPTEVSHPAFVGIQSTTNHNYINNTHSKNISLTANGLVDIGWSSIVDLPTFCITGKITNAENAINALINFYKDLDNFPGQDIDPTNPSCDTDCNVIGTICYLPSNITVNKNSTSGKITANIEWSTDSNSCSNGLSIEVEETINNIDQSIVENSNFWITSPIITNLNCNKARLLSYNITVNSKYNCSQDNVYAAAWDEYDQVKANLDLNSWYEIKKTSQQSNNSYSINAEFVEACP